MKEEGGRNEGKTEELRNQKRKEGRKERKNVKIIMMERRKE